MDKAAELEKLKEEIEKCEICKKGKVGKMVFGEGNPDAKIVFLGEAPGKQEAEMGRPFIGRSGKFLRSLIKEIELNEEDVYITSPVKYLPSYGTPTKSDIDHSRPYLLRQLDIIRPKIVVLLGRVAAETVFNKPVSVMRGHGKTIEKDGRKYFITLHPAAAVRFDRFQKIIKEDFQKLKHL